MRAILRLKQSGMSRAEIAKAIGVSKTTLHFWETGQRSAAHNNREKLIALAESRGLLLLASDFSMTNDAGEQE
jgi:transcriptional regulator with XRE-family HTH domain